jgi:hypothetical protein
MKCSRWLLLLCLGAALALAACGDDDDSASSGSGSSTGAAEQPAEEKGTVEAPPTEPRQGRRKGARGLEPA